MPDGKSAREWVQPYIGGGFYVHRTETGERGAPWRGPYFDRAAAAKSLGHCPGAIAMWRMT